MSEQIFTFQQCIERSPAKRHLLLGNGFSVALFRDIFNYKALKDKVTSKKINALFDRMNTSDFEYVMRRLTEASEVNDLYPDAEALKEAQDSDIEELKKTLIEVISFSHPPSPSSISEAQYTACQAFLAHFDQGKKYTFNYDLLLYWVYMHFYEHQELKLKCDDGFRTNIDDDSMVTWEIGREIGQDLYYLHGAMHLFSDGSTVEKYSWINTGVRIAEQVRQAIHKKKYPVFISEGSNTHKMMRITHNAYLGRSVSSLKNISGDLFIFGHSLRDEDDHIFDLILKESKVENIYISILKPNDPKVDNSHIYSKVGRWRHSYSTVRIKKHKKQRHFFLFDAETAKVWG